MKTLIQLSLIIVVSLFVFTSCDKDNMDDITVEDPMFVPDTVPENPLTGIMVPNSSDGLDLECITIIYPFEFLLESDETIVINSESDFFDALSMPEPDRVVDFVFPLEVIDSDGNTIQVQDNDQLAVLYGSCIPSGGWGNTTGTGGVIPAFLFDDFCFDLVYPADLEDLDGNIFIANDAAELVNLMATNDLLFFTLPIEVIHDNGDQLVIESANEFYDLVFQCNGINPPVVGQGFELTGFACFVLQFPFDVLDQDGNQVTVNDADEYAQLTLTGSVSQIVYPFTLVSPDGEEFVINEFEDLIIAFRECGIDIIIGPADPCDIEAHVLLFFNSLNIFTLNNYPYDINYPVTLEVDGSQLVLNSDDDYLPAIGGSPFNYLPTEIVYPVTITQFGQEIVLNSDDDVCQFYQTLDEDCANKPSHIQFFFNEGPGRPLNCTYFIDYPVEINFNGSTIQIDSRDEYLNELNNDPNAYNDIELVYPVSMTENISGNTVNFNNGQEICDYLDNCN